MWLLSTSNALGADVTLAWDANSEPELTGYHIYYGTGSRDYTQKVFVSKEFTTVTVNGLKEDVVYFIAATAVAIDPACNNKIESDYSSELVFTTSNVAGWPASEAKILLEWWGPRKQSTASKSSTMSTIKKK